MVRLVKGAYWDTEIKRAQERGPRRLSRVHAQALDRRLLSGLRQAAARGEPTSFYPQFATHNAHTVAAVLEFAGKPARFEFQRLHGMGEALYRARWSSARSDRLPHLRAGRQPRGSAGLSRAAPAGERRQHLVRQPACRRPAPIEEIVADPVASVAALKRQAASAHSAAAQTCSATERRNSAGLDLNDLDVLRRLAAAMEPARDDALAGGADRRRRHDIRPRGGARFTTPRICAASSAR